MKVQRFLIGPPSRRPTRLTHLLEGAFLVGGRVARRRQEARLVHKGRLAYGERDCLPGALVGPASVRSPPGLLPQVGRQAVRLGSSPINDGPGGRSWEGRLPGPPGVLPSGVGVCAPAGGMLVGLLHHGCHRARKGRLGEGYVALESGQVGQGLLDGRRWIGARWRQTRHGSPGGLARRGRAPAPTGCTLPGAGSRPDPPCRGGRGSPRHRGGVALG
jgi:hypothetical protein